MYKEMVENDGIFLEIRALLLSSAENGAGKFKIYICCFEFSRSGFPRSQDKRAGISKKKSVFLYTQAWFYLIFKMD